MASTIRFKPNRAGFNAVRNSAGVQALCLREAEAVRDRANHLTSTRHVGGGKVKGEFVADVRPGKTRCTAMVKPADGIPGNIAAHDCLADNVLLKAKGW